MTTETSSQPKETGYATAIHVMALLGNFLYIAYVPFLNIIIPWAMWLCKKNENPFVDKHGREAIRFQLFMTLYWFIYFFVLLLLLVGAAVGAVLMDASTIDIDIGSVISSIGGWFLFFLASGAFLFVLSIFCPIKAAIRASDGKPYCYPFTFSPRKKNSV